MLLYNLIAGGWGQHQFLGKTATHFPYFHLLTPPLKLSNEEFYIFYPPFLLQPSFLATQPPFNQSHLLWEK